MVTVASLHDFAIFSVSSGLKPFFKKKIAKDLNVENEKLLFNEDGTPTARTGKILAATPMGRFGESNELEGALLFLLNNNAASFITGVVLPVDGGFSAYSGV